MISPKTVMIAVEIISPSKPEVRSPIKILRPELTVTLPSRMVHNNKFPLLLRGRILVALFASNSSSSLLNGPLVINSKFLTSSPSSPRLSPEKIPDKTARKRIVAI